MIHFQVKEQQLTNAWSIKRIIYVYRIYFATVQCSKVHRIIVYGCFVLSQETNLTKIVTKKESTPKESVRNI